MEHPFRIQILQMKLGTQYNDGIVNNDIQNGTLTFDGQSSVGFALTLTDIIITSGTVGSSTQVGVVTFDTNTTYDLETDQTVMI